MVPWSRQAMQISVARHTSCLEELTLEKYTLNGTKTAVKTTQMCIV